jgi:hypothetical protein
VISIPDADHAALLKDRRDKAILREAIKAALEEVHFGTVDALVEALGRLETALHETG